MARTQKKKNRKTLLIILAVSIMILPTLVLMLIIYNDKHKTDGNEKHKVEKTIIATPPKETPIEETEYKKRYPLNLGDAKAGDRLACAFDKNDTCGLSQSDFDLLVLAVQHEVGNNRDLFVQENPNNFDFGFIQRSCARIFINQHRNSGNASLEETLSDSVQFGNLLEELYTIRQHIGYGDLESYGFSSEKYNLNDDITISNIQAVLKGMDENPSNLLFERVETAQNKEEAIKIFTSNYNDSIEIYYICEVNNNYGVRQFWVTATDKNVPE